MNLKDNRTLCLSLAKAETEKEAVNSLSKTGYWDNDKVWQYYGGPDSENNFSTIGNQQSLAEIALVEKIINSIDAVLLRECLRLGIDPEDKKAPKSIEDALHQFFHIYEGKLTNLGPEERAELAQNILLIATGSKSDPSYIIVDLGEGQTPLKMPLTFLSLHKSNKTRIPFVQGKFNMGSTGAFLFCGKFGGNNLQLLVSKRDPKIADLKDPSSNKWGFTIIRRENPKEGFRSSTFKYLAPKGEVLAFESEKGLPILPKDYPDPYGEVLEWGTFIKLYEYQLIGYKTLASFDLYNRLSLLLPQIALPIRILERRKGYSGHTFETTLSGLSVRLEEDKRENLEEGFPSSSDINIIGEEIKVLIYAFKRDSKEKYAKREGVVFTINGQAHGFISKTFFERKAVGMSYLSDSILLVADCSKFSGRAREDLFMNSRDRLREGNPLYQEIENQLEELLKNHPGLRELREKRRREDIENKLGDSKPLAEAIEKILKKSPALSQLFIEGVRILNPFKTKSVVTKGVFIGKKFPSYFKLTHEFNKLQPKNCPINRGFRVQFLTDVENDYFNRDKEPGNVEIKVGKLILENYSINLWNGFATLNAQLPDNVKEGDLLNYEVTVSDAHQTDLFVNEFYVTVTQAQKKQTSHSNGNRKESKTQEGEYESETPSYLSLPNVIEVRKGDENWIKRKFTDESAMAVLDGGDKGYDFYVNLDNVYLITELKGNVKVEPKVLEARFKYGMVLIGISLIHYFEKEKNEHNESFLDQISKFSSAVSPVLLPMIASLGDIEFVAN